MSGQKLVDINKIPQGVVLAALFNAAKEPFVIAFSRDGNAGMQGSGMTRSWPALMAR